MHLSWNDLRKGRRSQSEGEYFITFACSRRMPVFESHQLARIFCRQVAINEALHGCRWLSWVLMPDHFHGLLRLGDVSLPTVIAHLKGRSARQVNHARCESGSLWQRAYYDRALRVEDDRIQIARYIVANPLRAGLVDSIGNYPYWDSIYLSSSG